MLKMSFVIFLFAGLLLAATAANASRSELFLKTLTLTTHSVEAENVGDYFTLEVALPGSVVGKSIVEATLEFYVDAASTEKNGYVNDTPRIQVYALRAPLGTTSEYAGKLEKPAPSVMNIRTGDNRAVRVDVTDAVRLFAEEPTKNHGLIIGSLTGARDGLFTIRTDTLGNGVVAKLTVFFDKRN